MKASLDTQVKILFFSPEFFKTPPKKIRTEQDTVINRTYFLSGKKIVAVGEGSKPS